MRPWAKLQAANQVKVGQHPSAKKPNLLASKALQFQRTQRQPVAQLGIAIVKPALSHVLD
jgi:hypothetical protein